MIPQLNKCKNSLHTYLLLKTEGKLKRKMENGRMEKNDYRNSGKLDDLIRFQHLSKKWHWSHHTDMQNDGMEEMTR